MVWLEGVGREDRVSGCTLWMCGWSAVYIGGVVFDEGGSVQVELAGVVIVEGICQQQIEGKCQQNVMGEREVWGTCTSKSREESERWRGEG